MIQNQEIKGKDSIRVNYYWYIQLSLDQISTLFMVTRYGVLVITNRYMVMRGRKY